MKAVRALIFFRNPRRKARRPKAGAGSCGRAAMLSHRSENYIITAYARIHKVIHTRCRKHPQNAMWIMCIRGMERRPQGARSPRADRTCGGGRGSRWPRARRAGIKPKTPCPLLRERVRKAGHRTRAHGDYEVARPCIFTDESLGRFKARHVGGVAAAGVHGVRE